MTRERNDLPPDRPDFGAFLHLLSGIVGENNLLSGDAETSAYTTDWTGRYRGEALAVVRPRTTEEVAAIMRLCADADIAVVPQGGNTGLNGGGVPMCGRPSVIISLRRMSQIRSIDAAARTATVEAGVVLQTLQDRVLERDLIFPLMFGARGSCTIGGNLATNAGGSNVLRYGNARELCLGLEAVLPDGSTVNALTGLRKDNTGYDIKSLLTGAEGTLGIITAVVVKLFPRPKARATAFLSLASLDAALEALNVIQDRMGGTVEAFEYVPEPVIEVICRQFPEIRRPLAGQVETGILLEVASSRSDDASETDDGATALQDSLFAILSDLMETGTVLDAMFALSEQQRADLWKMRESVLESITAVGPAYHLDIALPLEKVGEFVRVMDAQAEEAGFRPLTIGHLGDGNLHYALAAEDSDAWDALPLAETVAFALDLLKSLNGSFSAEHGIGQGKLDLMRARKEPAQLAMMRSIKQALDPRNIMNPGKMIDFGSGRRGAGAP